MADWVHWGRAPEQRWRNSTKPSTKCLFQVSWPSSLLADGTRWSTDDAEETSTLSIQVSTQAAGQGNQGVAIETVNYEWIGRGRAGAVNIMDGLWCWCFTAPSKWQRWNQQRAIFLDRILETSDATYRHESCMTAVSHTYIQHTCTHRKYKQSIPADIHIPAMLKNHHIFMSDTEDYTRRQWWKWQWPLW